MALSLSSYAADNYFPYRFFGGVWQEELFPAGEIRPSGFVQSVVFGVPRLDFTLFANSFIEDATFGTPRLDFTLFANGFIEDFLFGNNKILSPNFPLDVKVSLQDSTRIHVTPLKTVNIRPLLSTDVPIHVSLQPTSDINTKLIEDNLIQVKAKLEQLGIKAQLVQPTQTNVTSEKEIGIKVQPQQNDEIRVQTETPEANVKIKLSELNEIKVKKE